MLDLIERLDELVCEILDPLDVLVLDLDERVSDTLLPTTYDGSVGLVLNDSLDCVRFNLFEFFELRLVLLVDVVEVLRRDDALETLVLLLSL